jgi:hypothetical protein
MNEQRFDIYFKKIILFLKSYCLFILFFLFLSGALKKIRVNKKLDKNQKLSDRSQINLGIDLSDDASYKGKIIKFFFFNYQFNNFLEPYQCTGKFLDDFQNLCKQNQLNYIPPIVTRPKRPTTPALNDQKIEKPKLSKKQSESFQSISTNIQNGTSSELNLHQRQQNSIESDDKDLGIFSFSCFYFIAVN